MAKVKGPIDPGIVRALKRAGIDAYQLHHPHPDGLRRADATYVTRRWPKKPGWPYPVFRLMLILRCIFAELSRQASNPGAITKAQYYPATGSPRWTVRDLLMRTAYGSNRRWWRLFFEYPPFEWREGYKLPHNPWDACPSSWSAQWFPYSLHPIVFWAGAVPPAPSGYRIWLLVRTSEPRPAFIRAHIWFHPPTERYSFVQRRGRLQMNGPYSFYREPSVYSIAGSYIDGWGGFRVVLPWSLPLPDPVHKRMWVTVDGYDQHGHLCPAQSYVFTTHIPPSHPYGYWVWPEYPFLDPWSVYCSWKTRDRAFLPQEIYGVLPP